MRNRVPIAANNDPDTSSAAAHDLSESGDLARRKAAVLNFVRTLSQPLTSHEVAKAMGGDRHEVAKRLPDLRDNDKAVENRGRRKCSITGRPALTWFAVDGNMARTGGQRPVPSEAATSASLPGRQSSPESATCARCKGGGIIRMRGTDPAVFVWCDEASGEPCRFAERRRQLNPDPNQDLSSSSALGACD